MSQSLEQRLASLSNDFRSVEARYEGITGVSLLSDPLSPPPVLPAGTYRSASIVIPAWNAADTLLSCLVAIEQSSFNRLCPDRLQVVVVDDGSTDSTWDILCTIEVDLNLVAVRQPHSERGKTMNAGMSVATGDIIICCDADMVLDHYAIEHMMVRHSVLDGVLLAGVRAGVRKEDPRLAPAWLRTHRLRLGAEIRADERLSQPTEGWPRSICVETDNSRNFGYGKDLDQPDGKPCVLPSFAVGALISLPRKEYVAIGGHDERFKGWGREDTYVGAKAIANGNYLIPVYGAAGLHISHPPRSHDREADRTRNRRLYAHLMRETYGRTYYDAIGASAAQITTIVERDNRQSSSPPVNVSGSTKLGDTERADSFLVIGEYEKALALYRASANSADPRVALHMGQALFGLRRYTEALALFVSAAGDCDVREQATIELSLTHAAIGAFGQARRCLAAILDENPDYEAAGCWYRGSVDRNLRQGMHCERQGLHYLATRFFEAALIADPENGTAKQGRQRNIDRVDMTTR